MAMIYRFEGNSEEFSVYNAYKYSNYFPLTNKSGSLLSAISPNLAGDIKQDKDRFLTPPATILSLKHNLLCRRDFFVKIFLPGERKAPAKIIRLSKDYPDKLQAGFFYHKITKYTPLLNAEILNFIPHDLDLEIMRVTLTNVSKKPLYLEACSCIPLYGRSETTLRDHRHVSSLLNRLQLSQDGLLLRPTLLFNEEGHSLNQTTYFCLGKSSHQITGQYPTLDYFCGEKNLIRPEAIYGNQKPVKRKQAVFDGKEALGALAFRGVTLKPKEKTSYILAVGLVSGPKQHCQQEASRLFSQVNTVEKTEKKLNATKKYWRKKFSLLEFDFGDKNYNGWIKWVKAQPTLRKLFGCSFLPHFDYGKGGRGWRDLWQDALALLFYQPKEARKIILNAFAGIRIDGSNATIINKDNSFLSDRNKISRVWSDHGVWPWITLKSYLDQTKNLQILNQKTSYFQDHLLFRAKKINPNFKQEGFRLQTKKGNIYQGSLLEHLLVQHLTAFFNVGKNNIIRLENADWNDALDMAASFGQTTAFTFIYAHNLNEIAAILSQLSRTQKKVTFFQELLTLLDTLSRPIDYQNYREKQKVLADYLEKTTAISGKKVELTIELLIADLLKKYNHLKKWLQEKEWLSSGFFNGYYDNRGQKVNGKKGNKIRMMLAPQVFAIMSGIAKKNQIKQIWRSANQHLRSGLNQGFRLNNHFDYPYQHLGRAFGFNFGDKENGAFFNHMNVMFAYSLYQAGFIKEGASVFNSIYRMSTSNASKTYPQLPEYFNNQEQGLYPYLTGSASWYIHTLLTQILKTGQKKRKSTAAPKLAYFLPKSKIVKLTYRKNKKTFNLTFSKN